jgi:uncharacterized protein
MPDKGYITTFTGIHFNLAQPNASMVCIEDIAHHLAMTCRWAGAVQTFFSVAQHSVLVSKIVPHELKGWALMHDAAEAYIGDLTRPFKVLLRENSIGTSIVDTIELNILRAVAEKFNLPWPEPKDLAVYDDQLQKLESIMLINHHDGMFHSREGDLCEIAGLRPEQVIPPAYLTPMLPEASELMFLSRFRKVFLDDDGL